jgi:hypothetical protein
VAQRGVVWWRLARRGHRRLAPVSCSWLYGRSTGSAADDQRFLPWIFLWGREHGEADQIAVFRSSYAPAAFDAPCGAIARREIAGCMGEEDQSVANQSPLRLWPKKRRRRIFPITCVSLLASTLKRMFEFRLDGIEWSCGKCRRMCQC